MDSNQMKQIEIGDNEVNIDKTIQLEQSETFQKFLKWCFDNKLYVHKSLQAPAAFGVLGIPGIAAKEDIPANTVIAAIPTKLMISLKDIKKHDQLKEIFDCKNKQEQELFNEKKAGDAEFNIIVTFLMFEKNKNGESFYQPYFETIDRSYTMYDWNEEEVKETECPELIDEFKHYLEDMEQTWIELKTCLIKYPQYFKEENLTKQNFLWGYELIMTRIFGYSLPCTCLVPFGDLFNHGNHSATHYIVNKYFEEDESVAHKEYKIKKHKIDVSIFDQNNPEKYKISGNDYHFRSRRYRFVKDHHKILPRSMTENIDWDKNYIEDYPLREMMYQINASEMKFNKEINIWDLKFFTTSATEDNDTDEEQTEGRKKEYDTLYNKEQKLVQNTQNRTKTESILNETSNILQNVSEPGTKISQGSTALEQIINRSHADKAEQKPASSGSEFEEGSEYESGEESDDEEEEQKEEQIQQEKKSKNITQKNQTEQKISQQKEEFKEDEALKIKQQENTKGENDKTDKEEHSVSSLSDDSQWEWYESQKENTYFAVTTEQPVKKGEQVFLCYGRRTNKFLLQWYGFAFQNNLFDSFGFRMWIKPDPHALEKNIEDQIIFRKYISEDDWKREYVMNNGIKIPTRELTKEFRLKRGHLCDEFVVYLRIYLSSHYNGNDISQILFTLPRCFGFEKFIFSFAHRILTAMRSRYTTTIEQDEALLKDHSICYKQRFATVIKLDHKKLLDEQIKIVEQIQKILVQLENNQFNLQKYLEQNSQQTETSQQDETENKENQQSTTTCLSEKIQKESKKPLKEIILTEEHTNSLKENYMVDFEGFNNNKDVLKERHKIKKYLEHLYLGMYKQYTA